MLSWAIAFILFSSIVWRYLKNKSTIILMLLSFTLSLRLQIGGAKIDANYILIICLAIAILLKQKGKIHPVKSPFKEYIILIVAVHVVYCFSWVVFNRNNTNELVLTLAGALKHIFFIYEILECNNNAKININKEIIIFLICTIIINAFAVAYEMIDYRGADSLLREIFFNESEATYLDAMVSGNEFSRYYGLFSYPMGLGMFTCYVMAFFLFEKNIPAAVRTIIIISTISLGLLSGSKSFIIGTLVILVAFLIINIMHKNIKASQLLMEGLVLMSIIIIYIEYDTIYNFIFNTLGASFARYFSFLKNINRVFYSRLDSNSGNLLRTIDVIKEYWMFGVGPTALFGELVADNAYIVILHNGGIIAFGIVAVFYCWIIYKSRTQKKLMLLLVALFATGMGFQTIIVSDITLWVILYILWYLHYIQEMKSNREPVSKKYFIDK